MSYAKAADGSRIWYQMVGGADSGRTPLVLIQGLALDHHGWDSAIADFNDRPVIVLDHRGTGASEDRFPDDWSTSDFAQDVVAVMNYAGVRRAHVYGHSMGGRIAQWLGACHADRVGALVLGATTVGDDTAISRPAHASEALSSGASDRLAALLYPDPWLTNHPGEATSVLPAPTSATAMRSHLAAVALHDGPDRRKSLSLRSSCTGPTTSSPSPETHGC